MTFHPSLRLVALALTSTATSFAFAAESLPPLQASITTPMSKLFQQPPVRQALDFIEKNEAKTVANTKAINAIAAPTFEEGKRARDMADRFKALGLDQVQELQSLVRRRGQVPPLSTKTRLRSEDAPIDRDWYLRINVPDVLFDVAMIP